AAVAGLLAAAAALHPAGFCLLDPAPYRAASGEVARRALTRLLLCVGGGVYPPRGARLERLHRALAEADLGAGRTLAGCRILPRRGGVLICREVAAVEDEVVLSGDVEACWDGRFAVRAILPATGAPRPLAVRRLGRDGWAEVAAARKSLRKTPIPGAVRPGLPTFHDLDGVVAVPHLKYVRANWGEGDGGTFSAQFRPVQPLGPPAFAFAGPGR
ncbi:MAG: tRNA lysidine(34) synthetase TilS, partial [Alphaproteobacteria bacterium]